MPSPYLIWGLLVYAWIANYMIRMALSSLLPPTGSFAWGCYGAAAAGLGAIVAMAFPPAWRLGLASSLAAREPRQV